MPVRSRGRGRGRGGAAGRERAGGQARANEPGRAPGSPRAIERRWHGCEAGRAEPKGKSGASAGAERRRRGAERPCEPGRARARCAGPQPPTGSSAAEAATTLCVRAWECARGCARAGRAGPGSASRSRRQQSRCGAKCLLRPNACGIGSSRRGREMSGGSGRGVLPGECRGNSLHGSGKTRCQDGRLTATFGEPSPPSPRWEGPT